MPDIADDTTFGALTSPRLISVDYNVQPSTGTLKVAGHPTRQGVVVIDLEKVRRITTLQPGEEYVRGEENLRRLEKQVQIEGLVLLDVRVMEELMANQHLIPEQWKTGHTYFWGTIFRDKFGDRYVWNLFWDAGFWVAAVNWLGDSFYRLRQYAAVIASKHLGEIDDRRAREALEEPRLWTPPNAAQGIETLLSCVAPDNLNPHATLAEAVGQLKAAGPAGSRALAELIMKLLHSRVRRLLEHYEAQTDEEAVAEDEAAFESTTHTAMQVPVDLVPAVRQLIATRRTA